MDGVLVAALCLKKLGFARIFGPAADASEAALIEGLEVIPCKHTAGVFAHLLSRAQITPEHFTVVAVEAAARVVENDLAEVHGQEEAFRGAVWTSWLARLLSPGIA